MAAVASMTACDDTPRPSIPTQPAASAAAVVSGIVHSERPPSTTTVVNPYPVEPGVLATVIAGASQGVTAILTFGYYGFSPTITVRVGA